MRYRVKPVYNEQIGQKRSLKASFRYKRSIFEEMYAIGENDALRYKTSSIYYGLRASVTTIELTLQNSVTYGGWGSSRPQL